MTESVFESMEEYNVASSIIDLLNRHAQNNTDDMTIVNGVLAAAAVYSHYAINKKQLNMFLEQDKVEVLENLGQMIDVISRNKGQIQKPLPN